MKESKGLQFWVVILALIWFCGVRCFGCWEEESVALLQLKASINYPNGTSLPYWEDTLEGNNSMESDCCYWERVECNLTTSHVVNLSLFFVRDWLIGDWYINASLFLPFKELRNLDLSDNALVGWVANEGFERLSELSKLEVLNLDWNQYNNSILSSLGVLSSLKRLVISSNNLSGSIQLQDFPATSNLEELDLSYNDNITSLTTRIGMKSLNKLQVLRMEGTAFNASVLHSLGALPSLRELSLGVEGLVTKKELEGLNNLEHLNLDYSSINGSFLQNVGVMTSLKVLSLTGSGLHGSLPTQGFCNLRNLEELYLAWNYLEGMLPLCLGNLTSLRVLDISVNNLGGSIVQSPLISLTSLEYLSLSNNHFKIPFSFASFFNHSKLEVVFIDNNIGDMEYESQTWIPKFQLKVFSSSNCAIKTLPPFLYYQNDLRLVDLSNNNLSGKFPTWLLENNTRVNIFNLRNNSFKGPFQLPSSPNPHILHLDVSNNYIDGQIPVNLFVIFPSLENLEMSNNMFEGGIPAFGDIRSLRILDLSNNNLSGGIPEHLAMGGSTLRVLKLSDNYLHGQIFLSSFNLTHLQWLHLDNNFFLGKIPNSLSNASHLKGLDMRNNHLSGMLSKWMANTTSLIEIVLAQNHLEGSIPFEWCKLDFLEFMDISENNLSGSLPSCFNPATIVHVHLNKNRLSGPLTHAFYNNSSLETLDLGDNNLNGKIPDWIGNLSELNFIILKANNFEGNIPTELCYLKQASLIDLSQNKLSGRIPHCLINMTFESGNAKSLGMRYSVTLGPMVTVSLGFIYPRTSMSYEFTNLKEKVQFITKSRLNSYEGIDLGFMTGIDLSCNQLTGEIPPKIGNLSELHSLNLSHNSLTGSIPTTFSNLRQIESLDLSYNNLTGSIPPEMTQLTSLAVFSVAHNNLSGKTPDLKAQFATFNESSYEGNPYLCGPPSHNKCVDIGAPSPMQKASKDVQNDYGFIDMDVFYVSFLVSYIMVLFGTIAVLYVNLHWRRAWFNFVEMSITK